MNSFKIIPLVLAFASLITMANAEPAKPAGPHPYDPFSPVPGDSDAIRIAKQCGFLSVMLTDSFTDAELDVARAYAQSSYDFCLAHAMPADWPDASATIEQGRKLFLQAKAKKPKLTDPESLSSIFDRIRNPPLRH